MASLLCKSRGERNSSAQNAAKIFTSTYHNFIQTTGIRKGDIKIDISAVMLLGSKKEGIEVIESTCAPLFNIWLFSRHAHMPLQGTIF
jgi:hypothetical protein